jgi:flagellar biosynthesis protein FlhG
MTSKNTTISFSILSGKGGVGKSNLALNICYGLHQHGHPVLLMDCDMGLANMDVLLGIAPQKHIQDVLLSNNDPAEVLISIGLSQETALDLIPANSGLAEFAELDVGARSILREKLIPLTSQYDYLCLDIGAGISTTALGFAAMTHLRIVVITPEPTSLTDSYAMMKILTARHNVHEFYILVNQVESPAEAKQTYNRLAQVCKRFLGFAPAYLGEVRLDRAVVEAVRKQKPLMQLTPLSPAAVDCMTLANTLQRLRDNLLRTENIVSPLLSTTIHD